jgi:acyl carrier protein
MCVHQKLSKYYSDVTPTTGLRLRSAHILDSVQTLQLFRKWDKEMDINPDDKALYTT